MGADQITDWNLSAASALQWWHDAGVDMLCADDPRDWLAVPEAAPATAPAPAEHNDAPLHDAPLQDTPLPDTLDGFLAWRMGPDAPEANWPARRLPPLGAGGAELMVLADMPEAEDAEALLSGAAGRLLDRMLAAIGRNRDAVHLATVAFARPASGRIPPESEALFARLARHHVALARPRQLLLLGQAAAEIVLGPREGRRTEEPRVVNHQDGQYAAVVTYHPRFLLTRPAAKAEAWKDLQLLIGGQ